MDDKRFIISGMSRGRIAAAFVEYRSYVRENGDHLGLTATVDG